MCLVASTVFSGSVKVLVLVLVLGCFSCRSEELGVSVVLGLLGVRVRKGCLMWRHWVRGPGSWFES